MKEPLKGTHFEGIEDIIENGSQVFKAIPKEAYEGCFACSQSYPNRCAFSKRMFRVHAWHGLIIRVRAVG